jgi:hypothetical protein
MRIIVTEQQASQLLGIYSDLIEKVLTQKNIVVKEVKIVPLFFPEPGVRAIVKLGGGQNKELARKLIKGILSGLVNFGKNKELSLSDI